MGIWIEYVPTHVNTEVWISRVLFVCVAKERGRVRGEERGGEYRECCLSIYNQLWRLCQGVVSFTLTSFVALFWWKVGVCAHGDEVRRKRNRGWGKKIKERTERSLPLQQACLSPPPPYWKKGSVRKKEREKTKEENMGNKRAWLGF